MTITRRCSILRLPPTSIFPFPLYVLPQPPIPTTTPIPFYGVYREDMLPLGFLLVGVCLILILLYSLKPFPLPFLTSSFLYLVFLSRILYQQRIWSKNYVLLSPPSSPLPSYHVFFFYS